MSKTVLSKILVRRDTTDNWASNNPILSEGEIGFDTTNGKHKIGDGVTRWNKLPYFVLSTDIDYNKTLYGIVQEDGSLVYVSAGGSGFSTTGNISALNNDVGYLTDQQVKTLIQVALSEYGNGDTDTYGNDNDNSD